jgi:hypothetical protein
MKEEIKMNDPHRRKKTRNKGLSRTVFVREDGLRKQDHSSIPSSRRRGLSLPFAREGIKGWVTEIILLYLNGMNE